MIDGRNKKDSVKSPSSTLFTRAFTICSIIICLIMGYMDRGPLLPPWPEQFSSIDCHATSFDGFTDRNGFLDFSFKVGNAIEYPPEYLPHFVSVGISTAPTVMNYANDRIVNITRSDRLMTFSLVHTWAGPSDVTVKCLNNEIAKFSMDLKDVTNWVPEYSRSDTPGWDHAKFRTVCLEYEKFLYFVQVSGDRPAVPFDKGSLRFEMLKWPCDAYLKHKNVTLQSRTCFLVSGFDNAPWKVVLGTLIPLAVSVQRNMIGVKSDPLFVFRKVVPSKAKHALAILGSSDPVKLADIMCFDTLLMTATYSSVNMKNIEDALEMDIAPLREKIPKTPGVAEKVMIADNLWDSLEYRIRELAPAAVLVRFGAADMSTDAIMNEVSTATMLVGDHMSGLIHMVWMTAPDAVVVDVTPPKLSCNPWAEKFAAKCGLTYKSFFKSETCECIDFECYPGSPLAAQTGEYDRIAQEIVNMLREPTA